MVRWTWVLFLHLGFTAPKGFTILLLLLFWEVPWVWTLSDRVCSANICRLWGQKRRVPGLPAVTPRLQCIITGLVQNSPEGNMIAIFTLRWEGNILGISFPGTSRRERSSEEEERTSVVQLELKVLTASVWRDPVTLVRSEEIFSFPEHL